ncbi:MAG: hydrogenase 3 maturation endopeptidase HyCI [Candidatus Omnitrophota bacterium]
MKNKLIDILKGKIVIVGMGNIMRGDDGFGPLLIENLTGRIDAVCIDAGTAPENYLGKIAKEKPDTILFIDAVDLGLDPGAYDILVKSEILNHGMTTHDISPNMLIDFLEKETEANIYMLGVQPKSISFGDEVSMCVKKAISEVADMIKMSCSRIDMTYDYKD